MNIKDAFPSKYLSAADLARPDGSHGTTTAVVKHVQMEQMANKEMKPVMYFEGKTKGMIVNIGNSNVLSSVYGVETDNWKGASLQIYVVDTEFQGQPTKGLRVRIPPQGGKPAVQPEEQPVYEPPVGAGGDDQIPF